MAGSNFAKTSPSLNIPSASALLLHIATSQFSLHRGRITFSIHSALLRLQYHLSPSSYSVDTGPLPCFHLKQYHCLTPARSAHARAHQPLSKSKDSSRPLLSHNNLYSSSPYSNGAKTILSTILRSIQDLFSQHHQENTFTSPIICINDSSTIITETCSGSCGDFPAYTLASATAHLAATYRQETTTLSISNHFYQHVYLRGDLKCNPGRAKNHGN